MVASALRKLTEKRQRIGVNNFHSVSNVSSARLHPRGGGLGTPAQMGVGSRKVGNDRAALNLDHVEPPTPFLE